MTDEPADPAEEPEAGNGEVPPEIRDPAQDAAVASHVRIERKLRGRSAAAAAALRAAQKEAAAHERTAQRALQKLEREREAWTQRMAKVKGERDEIRKSYHFSSAAKKLDLREIEGFSQTAAAVIADGRTGMNYDRLYTLWQAVHAAPADLPVIEIGSYLGGSARFISQALAAASRSPRFYVCDTFAGHADTDAEIDVSHHEAGKFENTTADSVAEYLAAYPAIRLVVGDIVETSGQIAEESFGLVHLDVDVYPTTRYCLRHFAPRLAAGAMMVVDDYGFITCPGVKRAADEFVAEFPDFRLWHLLTGQALLWRIAG